MTKLRHIAVAAALAASPLVAQAAATITFTPAVNTTNINLGGSFYQLVSINGGVATISGFGAIRDQNNSALGSSLYGGGPFELTYAFNNFTYTGYNYQTQSGTGFLASGGTFNAFFDTTPETHSNTITDLTQYNAVRSGFIDGIQLLRASGHGSGPVLTTQVTVTPAFDTTYTYTFAQLTANNGLVPACPAGTTSTATSLNFANSTATQTCNTPAVNTPVSTTGNTLAIANDFRSGVSVFDVIPGSGPAASNFNQNAKSSTLLNSTLVDFIVATQVADPQFNEFTYTPVGSTTPTTIGSGSGHDCSVLQYTNNLNYSFLCLGVVTISASVNPPNVTLVPEPSMLALLGIGALGVGFSTRRRLGSKA